MNWWWYDAVENARELAEGAKKSGAPKEHVQALARAITELCDALEAIAEKIGMPTEEPEVKHAPVAGMKKASEGKARKRLKGK